MFILPYIHSQVSTSLNQVNAFKMLTVGGRTLWKEETVKNITQVIKILLSNDIHIVNKPVKVKDLFLCEVDTKKTNIDDFYMWKDIVADDMETFCWRTYYTFGKENDDRSWLPIPEEERLDVYSCQEVVEMIHGSLVKKSSKP